MEHPSIPGSTLAEITQRFAIGIGPDEQWELLAATALDMEANTSGIVSTGHIGPLHNALKATMAKCVSMVFRSEFETLFPQRRVGRPGIDQVLCLVVVFLVNEEKKLDPSLKQARALKHVARLLGPQVKHGSVRSAYDKGIVLYGRLERDQLGVQCLITIWQEFNEFWEEHKESKKYAQDRSVFEKLRHRKKWWEIDRSIEWAK